MKKKKCNHKFFWSIYKIINFNKTFGDKDGRKFKCPNCKTKCILKWKGYKKMKKKPIKRIFIYFLWLLPAILLISFTVLEIITYIGAIILITLFHFGAMYGIINSDRLEIKEK